MITSDDLVNQLMEQGKLYFPRIVSAIVTFFVGLFLIRIALNLFRRYMEGHEVEVSLQLYAMNLASMLLKVLLLITVLSTLGVQMTSFVAIIGAAGLAIGLALQGSLSNFAGGALILTFKPYKVGDVIEAQGHIGKVEEIQVFNTVLKTPDNKTIIIPNGPLSNGTIVNFSTESQRRVDLTFGIGYDDDIKNARAIINSIIEADERILKEPAPQVLLAELADSSVNMAVRVWCDGADYWDIYFDMNEQVKNAFDEGGISIPFPQRDIHLLKEG